MSDDTVTKSYVDTYNQLTIMEDYTTRGNTTNIGSHVTTLPQGAELGKIRGIVNPRKCYE